MQVSIPSPRHYEAIYGSSDVVRNYLSLVEETVGQAFSVGTIDILRISLLIAHPSELAQGKFLEYEKFDWKSRFVAVGVNGNFERYHLGGDLEKILVLSEMLQIAFLRISKKRKSKLEWNRVSKIILHITHSFIDNYSRQ